MEFYLLLGISFVLGVDSEIQRDSFSPLPFKGTEKFQLPTGNEDLQVNVTYVGLKNRYFVWNSYDFFVPEVDVVCQCSCTDRRLRYAMCPLDYECAILKNLTTTCTIYNTFEKKLNICSSYYKLCCQVYFTKWENKKPLKALQLHCENSFFNFIITTKSLISRTKTYNVTIREHMNHFIIDNKMVLHIRHLVPSCVIPSGWYFIEQGTQELKFSETPVNKRDDDIDLNKMGWFQYKHRFKELSRVRVDKLKEHLTVRPLNCQSDPPKYEWELEAVHYQRRGIIHLLKNEQSVSKTYKNTIGNIFIDLQKETVTLNAINPSDISLTLSNGTSLPFLFSTIITDTGLFVHIIKGNGYFHGEITSPKWRDVIRIKIESNYTIFKLPQHDYNSCWICIRQEDHEVCQIPLMTKEDEKSTSAPTEEMINFFQTETPVLNTTCTCQLEELVASKNGEDTIIFLTVFTVILLLILMIAIITWLLKRRKIISRVR